MKHPNRFPLTRTKKPHLRPHEKSRDGDGNGDINTLRPSIDFSVHRQECLSLQNGDFVFRQGDPGDSLFIVIEGGVEISQGADLEKHVLATLPPGEFFGEMSLITDQPRTADATAVNQTLLLPVQKKDFLDRIRLEPELALYILQGLIIRLRAMLSVMSDPN